MNEIENVIKNHLGSIAFLDDHDPLLVLEGERYNKISSEINRLSIDLIGKLYNFYSILRKNNYFKIYVGRPTKPFEYKNNPYFNKDLTITYTNKEIYFSYCEGYYMYKFFLKYDYYNFYVKRIVGDVGIVQYNSETTNPNKMFHVIDNHLYDTDNKYDKYAISFSIEEIKELNKGLNKITMILSYILDHSDSIFATALEYYHNECFGEAN